MKLRLALRTVWTMHARMPLWHPDRSTRIAAVLFGKVLYSGLLAPDWPAPKMSRKLPIKSQTLSYTIYRDYLYQFINSLDFLRLLTDQLMWNAPGISFHSYFIVTIGGITRLVKETNLSSLSTTHIQIEVIREFLYLHTCITAYS